MKTGTDGYKFTGFPFRLSHRLYPGYPKWGFSHNTFAPWDRARQVEERQVNGGGGTISLHDLVRRNAVIGVKWYASAVRGR